MSRLCVQPQYDDVEKTGEVIVVARSEKTMVDEITELPSAAASAGEEILIAGKGGGAIANFVQQVPVSSFRGEPLKPLQ